MRVVKVRPSLALILVALAAGGVCSRPVQAQTLSWSIGYTGSITTWTVPYTGQYDITAYGAQGGGSYYYINNYGGSGAVIGGRFQLASGEVLSLLVSGTGGYIRMHGVKTTPAAVAVARSW